MKGELTAAIPELALALDPASDVNPVGSDHTVTVSLTVDGSPAAGETVDLTVSGANSASGSCVTDGAGQCSFTYTGTSAGDDTITASVTVATVTAEAIATKQWIEPPARGRITVAKVIEGAFDLGASFPFAADFDGDPGDGADFTLAADEVFDSGPVDAGVYSVVELVPAGWDLVGVECSDGSPASAIDVGAGETVVCTFTNRLEDDDDPYDSYHDDPGDPAFDFDNPSRTPPGP